MLVQGAGRPGVPADHLAAVAAPGQHGLVPRVVSEAGHGGLAVQAVLVPGRVADVEDVAAGGLAPGGRLQEALGAVGDGEVVAALRAKADAANLTSA